MLHTTAEHPTGRRRRVRDRPHRPPRGLHHRGPGDGRPTARSCCTAASSAPAPSSPPTPSSSTTSTSRPARWPSARRPRSSPTGPASTTSSTASRRYVARSRRFRADAAPDRLMLALVVTVPANEAELASDALWALGVAAVEERAVSADDAGDRGPLRRAVDVARQRRRRRSPRPPRRSRRAGAGARSRSTRPSPRRWRAHAVPSWVDADLVDRPGVAGRRRPPTTCCASTSIPARRSGSATTRRPCSRCACCAGRGGRARPCSTSGAAAACCRSSPPGSARPTSRRSTSRRRPSRRRSPTPSATASPGRSRSAAGRWPTIDEPFDVVLANLLAPVRRRPGPRAAPGRRAVGRADRQRRARRRARPRPRGAGADAGRRDADPRGLGGAARPPLRRCGRRQTARARTPIGAIRR